jgi:GNAT superfamily N-acetyltransferase
MDPEIRPFDRLAASDADYTTLAEIRNVFISEATPDDPPTTVQNTKNQLLHIPPVFEVHAWMAWVGDRIVATSNIGIPHLETNQHLAQIDIYVHPDYRGQGLATKFLPLLLDIAEKRERTMIVGNTYSTVTAGQRFMQALGGVTRAVDATQRPATCRCGCRSRPVVDRPRIGARPGVRTH